VPVDSRERRLRRPLEWLNSGCRRLVDTYQKGNNELLVSGYAWQYRRGTAENGGETRRHGVRAGAERSSGTRHGHRHALVFNDSHSWPQYQIGYGWSTYRGRRQPTGGLGYTLLLVARNDIFNGWPFPAVLPIAAARYDKLTVYATYIPTLGGVNNGSVLFLFGSIRLD
jgi:palmitoyl transferase